MHLRYLWLLGPLVGCALSWTGCASPMALTDWPAGSDPGDVGRRVAQRFVGSKHQIAKAGTIHYAEVCAWYGALEVAQRLGDATLKEELVARFEPLLAGTESALVPHERHVDSSVFGILPLQLALMTGGERYLKMGQGFADRQWENPGADGLTRETRFWIDDMYMITALQVQAWRATRDGKYLDRAAVELRAYLEKLQQSNGLFRHAPDVPVFWGRGNGWVAAGMAELLHDLPRDHPQFGFVAQRFKMMIDGLLAFQAPGGAWRQLVDHAESWEESSGTAMFAFALIVGVKQGILTDPKYAPAARRAWLASVAFLDEKNDLREVCVGTNKLNDVPYYLGRPRRAGDFHGQAPLLWAAAALLDESRPKSTIEAVE